MREKEKYKKPFNSEVEKILVDQIMDIVKGESDYSLIVETFDDEEGSYVKLLDLHQITTAFDFRFKLKKEEKGRYKRIVRFSHCVGNNNIKNKNIIKVELFVDSELSRFKILVEELESFILKKLILVDE